MVQGGGADLRGAEGAAPPPSSVNHSVKGKMLLFANCKIKHFAFSECRKCHFRDSRSVILNRGPHGPPGGNLQVLGGGGNTEHLGNWGQARIQDFLKGGQDIHKHPPLGHCPCDVIHIYLKCLLKKKNCWSRAGGGSRPPPPPDPRLGEEWAPSGGINK